MQRLLTRDEHFRKKHYADQELRSEVRNFHTIMQHPVNGVVTFSGMSRNILSNGLLDDLQYYYCNDGKFLFDNVTVNKIEITHTQLSGFYHDVNDQMPEGISYIAKLIEKNPELPALNLSHTQIGDQEALTLLKALNKNTRLVQLTLEGNPINEEILNKINERLKFNSDQIKTPTTKNWANFQYANEKVVLSVRDTMEMEDPTLNVSNRM